MKKLLLLLILSGVFIPTCYSKGKNELKKEVVQLRNEVERLHTEVEHLNREVTNYQNVTRIYMSKYDSVQLTMQSLEDLLNRIITSCSCLQKESTAIDLYKKGLLRSQKRPQCLAITEDGVRCDGLVEIRSSYCWKHQKGPKKQEQSYNTGTSRSRSTNTGSRSSSYKQTRVWYTGPRGGQYYINSNGNKVYKKR